MTEARRPLMAGNWKMNVNHLEAIALVQKLAFALKDADYDAVDVAVFPPFTDLRSVQTLIDGDGYRIAYVLVGHSERREAHAEGDDVAAAKVRAAGRHDIIPILCVGEGLDVRQQGRQVAHVLEQVAAGLDGVSPETLASIVIAYEPVWAIGTGEVATPADAQEVCGAIRGLLQERYGDAAEGVRILYGGSVKVSNVAAIMAEPDVDGCLVGGASLDPDEFVGIVRYRLLAATEEGA